MKSQNKTDTVLSGLIILIIYLFIQFVSGMIGGILALLYTTAKTGGNFDYMKVVAESQPVGLLVSEIISIAVFGIWYRSKYIKENGENQEEVGLKKIFNLRTICLIVCLTIVTYSIALLISSIVSFISPAYEEIFNSLMSLAIGGNTIIGYLGIILLAHILNNSLGILIPLLLHRELRITEIMVEIILFSIPIYFLNREDKELEPAVENKKERRNQGLL